jgi:hypothetical protein
MDLSKSANLFSLFFFILPFLIYTPSPFQPHTVNISLRSQWQQIDLPSSQQQHQFYQESL